MAEKLPVPQASALPAKGFDYGQMSGAGYEGTTQSDFAIPLLALLQTQSPQVLPGDPRQIKGAQPGMFLNTVTGEVIPSTPGIIFVPIVTKHVFVEFTPRDKGGGFRGVHELESDVVTQAKSGGTKFGVRITNEGNELSETFYVYGYSLESPDSIEPASPLVIPFVSSKIKVYRHFMQTLRTYRVNTGSGLKSPPLFANRLQITSTGERKPKGTFFNFVVKPLIEGDVGKSLIPPTLADGQPNPLLVAAFEFKQGVLSGKRTTAEDASGAAHSKSAEAEGDDSVFT